MDKEISIEEARRHADEILDRDLSHEELVDHAWPLAETYRSLFGRSNQWTASDAEKLSRLEAAFEEAGGRGVDLAEEIDALRIKRGDDPLEEKP